MTVDVKSTTTSRDGKILTTTSSISNYNSVKAAGGFTEDIRAEQYQDMASPAFVHVCSPSQTRACPRVRAALELNLKINLSCIKLCT